MELDLFFFLFTKHHFLSDKQMKEIEKNINDRFLKLCNNLFG